MLKDAVHAILKHTPYELRRRGEHSTSFDEYDLGQEIAQATLIAARNSMLAPEGLAVLYQQVAYCDQHALAGALVECGVWHGGSAALLAAANLRHGAQPRPLHLFDSFQGIPEPDAVVDGERAIHDVGGTESARGRLRVAWDYSERGGPGTASAVRELLGSIGYPQTSIHIHEGWFQETVPLSLDEVGRIALLHLDGDWYASTKVCLDYLYDRVTPGGFVVVNDYGAYLGCRTAVDEFLATLDPVPFLVHVNSEIRYWIKP